MAADGKSADDVSDMYQKVGDAIVKSDALNEMIDHMSELRPPPGVTIEDLPDGESSSVSNPDAPNRDEIKQQIQNAIDSITGNPAQLGNIMDGIQDQPDVMSEVLNYLEENPDVKNQAMTTAMGKAPSMQDVSRMSHQERTEILKKSKETRKQMEAFNPTVGTVVIVNNSRVAKPYPIGKFFPNGSKYKKGVIKTLTDGVLCIHLPDEKRTNRRVSRLVGETLKGEIIFFKEDNDGNIVNYSVKEYEEWEVEKLRKESAPPSSAGPAPKMRSQPSNRKGRQRSHAK